MTSSAFPEFLPEESEERRQCEVIAWNKKIGTVPYVSVRVKQKQQKKIGHRVIHPIKKKKKKGAKDDRK